MKWLIPVLLLLTGCSTLDQAEVGQTMDVATTAVGIAEFGMVEANPMGYVALPLKVLVNEQAELLVQEECNNVKRALSTAGWGAASANITTIAAGAFTVGSVAVGILAGTAAYKLYTNSRGCTETDKLVAFEKRWQLAKQNLEYFEYLSE